jgi:ATP-dependent Clp protease ATP-binding subunit ClpC
MLEDFGESAKLVLGYARREAEDLSSEAIGTEHLFLGVAELEDLALWRLFQARGVDLNELCRELRSSIERGAPSGYVPFAAAAEQALEVAKQETARLGERLVEAPHILLGVLRDADGLAATLLDEKDVDLAELADALTAMLEEGDWTPEGFYRGRRAIEQPAIGSTRVLDSLGRDLTEEAARGELSPIIGRERELVELIQVLCGKRKRNAVLVGEAGVGKTAIVEGLAQRIVQQQVPDELRRTSVRTIEVGSLVAGTIYRGQFEQRLRDVIDEVRDRPDVILFIDEVHMLIGAGEAGLGTVDAANMLKPVLSEGRLRVIGATTTDEYRQHFERDKALMRRFQPIAVGEPSREDTVRILTGLRPKYAEFHRVEIRDDALGACVKLSARYMHDRFLPDKALDLLDRACTQTKLAASMGEWMPELATGGSSDLVVDTGDVADVVSVLLEIPIATLTADERERLLGMTAALKETVIGQDEAVEVVAQTVLAGRVGLGDPERPYGVFLFLGPTGVGKTKLAEEVAGFLFGSREELIRLDMSEYMERYTVSGLIGSPPGYVGWGEGGKLTNAVRTRPYAVVLLDEVEKAHPDVWNLFLQVFEDGRLTDAAGRLVDFRHTVIVMTSNVGARGLQAGTPIGFGDGRGRGELTREEIQREVDRELRRTFAPEFLNRIDELVVFNPLPKEALRRIIRALVREMIPMELRMSDAALDFLVEQSYDPAMGARPARRAIQRLLRNPLSLMLARGEFADGDAISVGVRDGALRLRRAAAKAR